jgi:hypothetical protein
MSLTLASGCTRAEAVNHLGAVLPSLTTSSQIKTRLQKQKPRPDGSLPYAGFVDCARKIAQAEGAGAFYKVRGRAREARSLWLRLSLDWRGVTLLALLLAVTPPMILPHCWLPALLESVRRA